MNQILKYLIVGVIAMNSGYCLASRCIGVSVDQSPSTILSDYTFNSPRHYLTD